MPACLSACVLLAYAGSVAGQDAGGVTGLLDFGQRFEGRNERGFTGTDGGDFRSVTSLGYGLTTRTRTESLSLGLSSGLASSLTGGGGLTFEDSLATLDYSRESRSALLTFGASYTRTPVDDLVFDGELSEEAVVSGDGDRAVLALSGGLVLGRDAPLTTTLNYSLTSTSFDSAPDSDLNDALEQSFDARFSFQLSPTLTTDIFATITDLDEDGAGAVDRDTRVLGVSASYQIDPITVLAGDLAYREEETGGIAPARSDGLDFGLSLTHEHRTGDVSFDFAQEDGLTGIRRQFVAGHALTLPRATVNYSLGLSVTDAFDPQPLANISVAFEPSRNSTAEVAIAQEGTINTDLQEVVNSSVNLSYGRTLTSLSSLSTSIEYTQDDVLDESAADQRSFAFDLSYEHELAQDWSVVSGYAFSLVRRDGLDDRSRASVFIGLQKSTAFRP